MHAHRVGTSRVVGAAAVMGLAALLAGCSGQAGPAPAAPPPASERPQPAETPAATPVATEPESRLSVGCTELIPEDAISAALTAETTLRPIGFDDTTSGPVALATQQLGAVNCVWADGALTPWQPDSAQGRHAAHLTVVPDAETAWQAYSAQYGPEQDGPSSAGEVPLDLRCVPDIESCFFEALVGTSWVDLALTGVGGAGTGHEEMRGLVTPLTDALVQTLAAEPAPPARWVVPATTTPLPVECTDFLSDADTEQLAGASPFLIGVNWDGPELGQQPYGLSETGAQRCQLALADSDSGIGSLAYLPGGGWGFDALRAGWAAEGSITAETVAGVRAEDAAFIRCGVQDQGCSVDIRFGGNWVQLTLGPDAPGQVYYPDGIDISVARGNIGAFAETIVGNLNRFAG